MDESGVQPSADDCSIARAVANEEELVDQILEINNWRIRVGRLKRDYEIAQEELSRMENNLTLRALAIMNERTKQLQK